MKMNKESTVEFVFRGINSNALQIQAASKGPGIEPNRLFNRRLLSRLFSCFAAEPRYCDFFALNVQDTKIIMKNGFCYLLLFNEIFHPLLIKTLGAFPLMKNVLDLLNKIKYRSKLKLKMLYSNGLIHLYPDKHGTYLTPTDFLCFGYNIHIGGFRQEKLKHYNWNKKIISLNNYRKRSFQLIQKSILKVHIDLESKGNSQQELTDSDNTLNIPGVIYVIIHLP